MADGTAVVLPVINDPIPEGAVSAMKVKKITVGGDTTDVQYDIRLVAGDSAAPVTIAVLPPRIHIYDVGWRVVVAFTASLDLILGDTDDDDGWGKIADLGCTVADTEIFTSKGIAFDALAAYSAVGDTSAGGATYPAYAAHGRFTEADTVGTALNFNLTTAAADAATGLLEVYLFYHNAFYQSQST